MSASGGGGGDCVANFSKILRSLRQCKDVKDSSSTGQCRALQSSFEQCETMRGNVMLCGAVWGTVELYGEVLG